MRVKLEDVARAAGVSRTAASRAMNGQPGTTDAVRDRVRETAARLGFRPHAAARALAAGRTDAIEILIVDPEPDAFSAKPYYGRVVAGALRELAPRGIALRVRLVPASTATADDDPPLGRVLVNVPDEVAAAMDPSRTVSLGRSAPGVRAVAPDNRAGARQAGRHLVATGRRRIGAVLGPPANPCAAERRAGFLDAMVAAGVRPVLAHGDFTRDTADQVTRRLLAARPDLDAVFAACDVTATGVLRALADTGRRVPDDVAVVGFDGTALAEAAGLTSVYAPTEDEAAYAVRALLDPSAPLDGDLATSLVVRATG